MATKNKFDKLTVLDQCIKGNYDKLIDLISDSFDHLDKFYNVCSEVIGSENITSVGYKGYVNDSASFIVTTNKDVNIEETIESVASEDDGLIYPESYIELEKTNDRIAVNIFINGGVV